MSSNLWKLYKNYRCPEIEVLKDLSITNSLSLQCNTIDDVSGINFCDGTYIGHGSSFDISTNEVLKINTDAIIVNTDKSVGIGTSDTDTRKFAVEGNTLVRGNIDAVDIDINGTEIIDANRNIYTNLIINRDSEENTDGKKTQIELSNNLVFIDSSYGRIEIGSLNTGWAHFLTDRPRFFFEKTTSFDGPIEIYDGSIENNEVVIDNQRNIHIRSAIFDDTSNNIVLLGGSNTVEQTDTSACYIKPIQTRNTLNTNRDYPLYIDTSTNEIFYYKGT